MKITPGMPKSPAATEAGRTTQAPASSAAPAQSAATSSMSSPVELSPLAKQLSGLTQATQTSRSDEIDQARVDAIKSAISEGRLSIHPEAIANKLLESVGELLKRH